jgi:DNA polymerase III alpha subunit
MLSCNEGSFQAHWLGGCRQVIVWDKDDIDAPKFMKVDCLALGMLTCMKCTFDFLAEKKDIKLDLATIPSEDPRTYAIIRKADTLGVCVPKTLSGLVERRIG